MNLDNLELFKQLDSQNLLAQIDSTPEDFQSAWDLGAALPTPEFSGMANMVIAAAGDSALAADLAYAAVSSTFSLPLTVHRDYGLPAFAKDKSTLVIGMGESEETLDALAAAQKNGCSLFAISTADKTFPAWKFPAKSEFIFSLGLLLALFSKLGPTPNLSAQVNEAIDAMKTSREHLRADVPAANNPAKRYAGQLVGRWVTFFGAGSLSPVAQLWKTRINRLAKAAANFESIPEAKYNTAYGILNPAQVLNAQTMSIFLRAPADSPRNKMSSDMLRQHFMLEGMNTDVVDARGESALATICTLILFGDYMAYYLAMAYGVNPA